ncbi:inositol monophosphatase family protein [Flaviflexus huanghaiensis]|uniref:inositol monophosphatase family protein n=1 Tax=Flaviflexus huanghaiensis TaxID=1111473 RepID=UPI0015F7B427
MSETNSAEIRSFLLDLVAKLGPGVLAASRERGDLTSKTSFHDVVTVHDEATEVAIREAIFTRFPDSHVLGEESGWSTASGPSDGPGDDDLYWLVDPIDGTSNFAAGWDYWCISIAAVRSGELRASAVHQPRTSRTWSADDDGAYLDEPGQPTRVLQVDPTVEPQDGLCMTEYPSIRVARDDSSLLRWREAAAQFRSMRRTGSTALDLCFVADGSGIASFSTGTNSWDVAAGIHILQRAGAIYESYTDAVPTHPVWDGPEYIAAASHACLQVGRETMGL